MTARYTNRLTPIARKTTSPMSSQVAAVVTLVDRLVQGTDFFERFDCALAVRQRLAA
jgi:hypothetical protein